MRSLNGFTPIPENKFGIDVLNIKFDCYTKDTVTNDRHRRATVS